MACRQWRELSRTDFDRVRKDTTLVILPIGSMEQHGPHLPVSTDSLIVEAVVQGVAEKLKDVECLFLPTVWCSRSNEHEAFPGTVSLSRETFIHLLEDIGASVARAGFKKLVFANAHGGNTDLLGATIRDIRQSTGLLTFDLDLPRFYDVCPSGSPAPGAFDIHAARFETSVVLARYPQLMEGRDFRGLGSDRERGKVAASFRGFKYLLPEGGPVTVAWLTGDYTEDGVIGDPTGANAADGQRDLEALVRMTCEVLREIAAFEYRS